MRFLRRENLLTPARFLRTVLLLWGDHWQQPCVAFLASNGHQYSRKTLWAYKTGNRRIPQHVADLLAERKAAGRKPV